MHRPVVMTVLSMETACSPEETAQGRGSALVQEEDPSTSSSVGEMVSSLLSKLSL